jgi:uncharacterized linocin/CFP29 family protein
MDILRRNLAPITQEAWAEIEEEAERMLRGNLSARSLVDFDGPHGWQLAALNLGKLTPQEELRGVNWGIREVKPLIETRVAFVLNQQDLDSVTRGSKTPELDPVQQAARKAALFEEKALYLGFERGSIEGIASSSPHDPVSLGQDPEGLVDSIETAMLAIQREGIAGPYNLALGTEPYSVVMKSHTGGRSLESRLVEMIQGEVKWSPALEGGVFLSSRGGDYELTVGQDLSVGYASHDRQEIEFYITESFTFQVLEPAAAVKLDWPS